MEIFLTNCLLLLNWIVWNMAIYLYENGFGIKWPTNPIKPKQTKRLRDQHIHRNLNEVDW